jgi:hypothetical protein
VDEPKYNINGIKQMRCIYCLKDKDKPRRIEHVIPQSFGVFKNNFVLREEVCDVCNQFLGDTLEMALARDTIEGIKRYDFHIKKPLEFKSLGKRSRLIFKIAEGFFRGAYAYREYSSQEKRILLKPCLQVGLLKVDGSGYEYFLSNKIPLVKSLSKDRYNLNDSKGIIILGNDYVIVDAVLKKQGYEFRPGGEFDCPDKSSSLWMCNVKVSIDQTILRAAAKIAFNYLTYCMGVEFALQKDFNHVRRFILSGDNANQIPIRPIDKSILADEVGSDKRRLGHIVTINWAGDKTMILAQVSLFNWIVYQIILTRNYQSEKPNLTKGHFFDVHNHTILELGSKPLS